VLTGPLPGPAAPGGGSSGCMPPALDEQPALQLSLDLLLVENYQAGLRSHAHSGEWSDGGGKPAAVTVSKAGVVSGDVETANDGAWRHGIRFEPLGNVGGLWQSDAQSGAPGGFERFPASPTFSATALWLGVIEAGMSSVLMFELQDWNYGGGHAGCQ
jgi:hypothetical protein